MGQTLTHGVYLPDEGERNCYSGLASNWSILDGAVGTVAEHTTALAGKAPLVHTHTKADITDFPVYGTTAGTICEGNDSRLSDARTPVAHTHGKADITDLFNSANTWSGNQTYSGLLSLSSSSDVAEQFKQKLPKDVSTSNDAMARVNALVDSAGHYVVVETIGHWSNYVAKNITLKYKNDSTKQGAIEFRLYSDGSGIVYPQSSFGCDLGNTYNKWKSLNGVNPGALSLPATDTTDASGDIIPPSGESSINLSGDANTYTPSNNGWLTLAINNASGNCIIVRQNTLNRYTLNYMQGSVPGQANIYLTIPVLAGVTYYVFLYATSFVMARFALCQGNV